MPGQFRASMIFSGHTRQADLDFRLSIFIIHHSLVSLFLRQISSRFCFCAPYLWPKITPRSSHPGSPQFSWLLI